MERTGRKSRQVRALAGAVFLLGHAGAAAAQTQPPTAPTGDQIERQRATSETIRNPSRLTVEGGVERSPCPLADPSYEKVTVRLAAVQFNRLEGVSADVLAPAWTEYAGKEVPVATLCEIRDRAATILRDMGYLAAVQIPPQRIEGGGTVVMDVLMAHLGAIQVRGDAGHSEGLIARMLEQVAGDGPFNTKAAERRLLLARDLPGFDVRLILRPARDTPGTVTGEVIVRRQPVEFDVNFQNYGSLAVGRYSGLARLQINDITGLGDATVFSLFNTTDLREQTVVSASHSFAIGSNGLRFNGDFTYAWSKPEISAGTITSRTIIGSAGLSYPIIRRQTLNLGTSLGFELVDQRVYFGAASLSTDKLRVFSARADFDMTDPSSFASLRGYSILEPRWRFGGAVEVRQGVDGLGASRGCGAGLQFCLPPFTPLSRLAADPAATVLRFSGNAEFRPIPSITFVLQPRGQYSDSVLLSYEEISSGNYTIGRGYDPGVLLGDSGVGYSAELRVGSLLAHRPRSFVFQPYAFVDQAWAWRNDAGPLETNPGHIGSAGGGLRGGWNNVVRFDFTVAAPFERAPLMPKVGPVRFLFSITTRLIPWRAS